MVRLLSSIAVMTTESVGMCIEVAWMVTTAAGR